MVEDGESRHLRFESSFQSGMYLDDPFRTRYTYTDFLQLPLAYRPGTRKILFIGLGGGSVQKRLWRDFPGLDLQVVELDPVVRDVAYRYFRLPHSSRLGVTIEDGRRFLQRNDERWDAIVIDAYFSDSIPFHLTTLEFLQLARSRLMPGGVIASNLIGSIRGDASKLFRSMYKTYRAAFPTVSVHPVRRRPAIRTKSRRTSSSSRARARRRRRMCCSSAGRRVVPVSSGAADLTKAIRDRHEAFVPTRDVPVLTDDYAPTDALLFLD